MYLTVTGLILKREPQGEHDLKLTLLTLDQGKLIVRARGARRLAAKVARHLDFGTYTTLELSRIGETNLAIGSNGAKLILRTDSYSHFAASARLLVLADRLAPVASPEPEIFSVLVGGLQRIRLATENTLPLILQTEMNKLIQRAGWETLEQIPS